MRRINRCLNTKLFELGKRSVQLEELNSKLQKILPLSLQTHCHVGSFTAGCLVIVVDNAVWASELRYILPELRDKLRSEAGIYQLSSIKSTVTTINVSTVSKPIPSRPPLSEEACKTLIESGDQCSYDPLKRALHNLARHGKTKN